MAKFTIESKSKGQSKSEAVPVKLVQNKKIRKHKKYLIITCIVQFIIIAGLLFYCNINNLL